MRPLRQAIADLGRLACAPKVDGIRGLVVYQPVGVHEMRNRPGEKRDWLRGDAFEAGFTTPRRPTPERVGRGRPRPAS